MRESPQWPLARLKTQQSWGEDAIWQVWPLAEVPIPKLTPEENTLFAPLRQTAREAEWLAGRWVAKNLLMQVFSIKELDLSILKADSGAPRIVSPLSALQGWTLSLSHSKHHVAAALSRSPIGIDVSDLIHKERFQKIAKRVLTPGEDEATQASTDSMLGTAVWALKEAYLKAREEGVFDPGMQSVRLTQLFPDIRSVPAARWACFALPGAVLALCHPSPNHDAPAENP